MFYGIFGFKLFYDFSAFLSLPSLHGRDFCRQLLSLPPIDPQILQYLPEDVYKIILLSILYRSVKTGICPSRLELRWAMGIRK